MNSRSRSNLAADPEHTGTRDICLVEDGDRLWRPVCWQIDVAALPGGCQICRLGDRFAGNVACGAGAVRGYPNILVPRRIDRERNHVRFRGGASVHRSAPLLGEAIRVRGISRSSPRVCGDAASQCWDGNGTSGQEDRGRDKQVFVNGLHGIISEGLLWIGIGALFTAVITPLQGACQAMQHGPFRAREGVQVDLNGRHFIYGKRKFDQRTGDNQHLGATLSLARDET